MVVLGDFVWMAVFTDLVAVNANVFFFISLFVFWLFSKFWLLLFFLQNLARIELKAAHQDRVHSLVPVIQTNQVLYFMRNASVCRYSPFTLLFLVHLASRFSSFSVLRFSLLIVASCTSRFSCFYLLVTLFPGLVMWKRWRFACLETRKRRNKAGARMASKPTGEERMYDGRRNACLHRVFRWLYVYVGSTGNPSQFSHFYFYFCFIRFLSSAIIVLHWSFYVKRFSHFSNFRFESCSVLDFLVPLFTNSCYSIFQLILLIPFFPFPFSSFLVFIRVNFLLDFS